MATVSEERLIMDVEIKLRADESGEFRDGLRRELTEHSAAIESKLKTGTLPDEYQRLGKIKKGLEAADAVLERLWLFHHSSA